MKKSWRRIWIFGLLFSIWSFFSYSNDWEFGSRGEHMVSFKNSRMKIKDEKIMMKLEEDKSGDFRMKVKVRFVFENEEEGKKIIGFVTPEREDNDAEEENAGKDKRLGITNFLSKVNGKTVLTQQKALQDILSKGILDKEAWEEYREKKYWKSDVYYLEAPFFKGENVVEHEYYYTGSYGIFEKEFAYILTTISKWQDQRVENFELLLDMKNAYVALPYTFWKNHKKIEWEMLGEGKSVEVEEGEKQKRVYLRMKNGVIRYRAKNFSPDKEFHAVVITDSRGTVGRVSNPKNSKYILHDKLTELLLRIQMEDEEFYREDLEKLTGEELELLRNYPYAFAGYDFSRKDLKAYFSQFVWYLPLGTKVPIKEEEVISVVDNIKKGRE
ncbi:YARHG domain-containing protein [Fusobacterium necrophorum]|uniref:YARHG domain-containing protein n=1 Tax=Fusobacterium necrophorum TaxID=859 RepID=UPI00254E6B98|nr:YARHG domain-containing protein [Fusobacterium necrophorum]MDK4482637.1 YARHG domain-containing protein [Fusobacterium necrophorum]MDK4499059.1 YARHG domain-containing protein [Fusobacterium necrophorum]MDK4507342.1 YARHG domain-containing protein [Fusobacterium necrophorum]MDK4513391.1 YARHG domain-containing protein [Fusobacterium necrophorum]MDK4519715.1 YARHG domain-containing protein [Fusobacterium necrophorum]